MKFDWCAFIYSHSQYTVLTEKGGCKRIKKYEKDTCLAFSLCISSFLLENSGEFGQAHDENVIQSAPTGLQGI